MKGSLPIRRAIPLLLAGLGGALVAAMAFHAWSEARGSGEGTGALVDHLWLAAAVLAGCVLAWAYLRWRFAQPLDALVAGVSSYRAGHGPLEVPTDGPGEIAQVGRALQHLVDELARERAAILESDAALAASEARYRAFIERAPMAVGVARNGRFAYVNQAYLDMHLLPNAEALVGMPIASRVAPSARAAFIERATRREAGLPADERYELMGLRADGAEFPMVAFVTRVQLSDGPAVVGFFEDVSDRKQNEVEREHLQTQLAQSQKMESIGRLAGGVAHDFNNMLAVILGQAEVALEDLDTEGSIRTALLEIQRAAERSGRLTQQLLAFARRQPVAPRVLDLTETVQDTLSLLRRLIGEQITLAWLPGANVPPVKMDPGQIDQVLANLCVNARDAIGGVGQLTIETRATRLDEAFCASHPDCRPGLFASLIVQDNGCGMDEATQAHIFEPFFTTKPVGVGTGLGLATVYGVVTQNAGAIDVESAPGRGSRFTIHLPACVVPAPEPAEVVGPAPLPRGDETVLLVEDEPSVLTLASAMLASLGYHVLTASTPMEAVALAATHQGRVDLLITDVVMPEMNGRQLAQHLQAGWPHLRCIYISGYTADLLSPHGVLATGIELIQKPFSRKELATRVRAVLDAEGCPGAA